MCTFDGDDFLAASPIRRYKGAIYVPDNLVNTYRSDSKWNRFSILPIANYPATNFETISDNWEEIVSNIRKGNISKYLIGSIKQIRFGEKDLYVRLVGTNKDVLSGGTTETAQTTWAFINAIGNKKMNETATNENGYINTSLYTWLLEQKTLLPDVVKNNLKTVVKTYYDETTKTTLSCDTDFWLFSGHEITGDTTVCESSGCVYDQYYTSNYKFCKADADGNYVMTTTWTRTARKNGAGFIAISSDGIMNTTISSNSSGAICPGFCI